MRRIMVACIVSLLMAVGLAGAADPGCKYCGMSLTEFASSAVTITYEDGTSSETCSLHCAAVDLAVNIDKAPKSIMVGDLKTGQKTDAEAAVWVLDPKNPGIMTKHAKWAFANKAEAEKYVKESPSAKVIDFEAALQASYEDMYADTKAIRDRKAKRKTMQEGGHQHGDMHKQMHGGDAPEKHEMMHKHPMKPAEAPAKKAPAGHQHSTEPMKMEPAKK